MTQSSSPEFKFTLYLDDRVYGKYFVLKILISDKEFDTWTWPIHEAAYLHRWLTEIKMIWLQLRNLRTPRYEIELCVVARSFEEFISWAYKEGRSYGLRPQKVRDLIEKFI